MAAMTAVVLSGCATGLEPAGADVATSLTAGLTRQVVRPGGCADPTPADGLPGELATKLYQNRYIKMMTEKQDDEEQKASAEFD